MSSDSLGGVEPALDVDGTRLPNAVIHFVGRTRGGVPVPTGLPQAAEGRTASILLSRRLFASRVPSSDRDRAVCASDVSIAELHAAFARGMNHRGAFQPWAIVLDRIAVYRDGAGMRPVHYVHHSRLDAYRRACESVDGPGWGGLVIPIRLTSHFGSVSDWMHEREWRWCAPPDEPIAAFEIRQAVKAVIVGERGWQPEWTLPGAPYSKLALPPDPEYTVQRWFWDPDRRLLEKDGTLTVPALMPAARTAAKADDAGKAGSADAAASSLIKLNVSESDQEDASGVERPTEARVDPNQILVDAGGPGTARWQLHCPRCGENTIDRSVHGGYGPDHEAVTIHPDRDGYDTPIGTRGGYVSIDLMCACGHAFALVIGNHKGAEFIGVVSG